MRYPAFSARFCADVAVPFHLAASWSGNPSPPMPNLKRVIVLVEHRHGYFRDVLRGVRTYARQGHPWVLHSTDSAAAGLDHLLASPFDGIVGHTGGPIHYRTIQATGLPVVHTVRLSDEGHAPFVVTDDQAVGRMAAEHLLELGLRHFAFAGEGTFPHAILRAEGYARRLREQHPKIHVQMYLHPVPPSREFDAIAAEGSFMQWLSELPRPIGLFAVNDTWAAAISERCHECGTSIPDQVALIGVDNDDLVCESANPPISSVQTAGQRIGYEAARLLDALMGGRRPEDAILEIPPVQVVARESTNAMPAASPPVLAAVRFIRAQSYRALCVADVVAAAHASRRLLEQRFRNELGRTVLDEVHRAQVDRARHLLVETDLPMSDVAEATGFANATRMGIVFLKLVGTPPSAYRARLRIGNVRRA